MKVIYKFFICFISVFWFQFYSSEEGIKAQAKTNPPLSDKEKKEFIEQLAESSNEKQIFYRWQTKGSPMQWRADPKIKETNKDIQVNGMYVSSDIHSSSFLGDNLVQVEVDATHQFLDVTKKKMAEKLVSKGITQQDIQRLNPQIAIKAVREGLTGLWILRSNKGVKVKPFSSQGVPLKTLEKSYSKLELANNPQNKQNFLNLIQGDIQSRARRNFSVLSSPLVDAIDKSVLRNIANRHIKDHIQKGIPLFKNASEASSFLDNASYLSKADRGKVLHNALPLFNTPEKKFLFLVGEKGHISNKDYARAQQEILSHVKSKKELQSIKPFLTDKEYAEASKKAQPRSKPVFSPAGKLTEKRSKNVRLNCLKKQLSTL